MNHARLLTTQSKGLVAVTGASGFIAGVIIEELLKAEYKVRGTVRSLANAEKVAHLQAKFPGIELFEADLLTPGSFNQCFAGCDYVVHAASPFQLKVEDAQKDLVDPAVNGTTNVVEAAIAESSVKRIVVTSSVAAVMGDFIDETYVYTEADWNNDSTLEKGPYRLSKSLAEKKAWQLVKENNRADNPVELAAINPSFVIGAPKSARTDSTSVAIFKSLLDGSYKDGVPPLMFGIVHVRDVAVAHVLALEKEAAAGKRIIVSSEPSYSLLELADILRQSNVAELEPFKANLPTTLLQPLGGRKKASHALAEEVLGLQFTSVEEAAVEMATALIELGVVSI